MEKDLRAILAHKLEPRELKLIYKSYDIAGDIAIIRVPEPLKERSKTIAEAVMQTHKNIKSVWCQTGAVSGEFRLRKLKWVAGENRTETICREYGCLFKVDLEKCYFSPRLSFERMRIAQKVQPGEVISNMFAGVGCYSIVIAKHSEPKKIFSMDINPVAIQYMQENINLNKVEEKVVPVKGDAKKVIDQRLKSVADRVLMPLPEEAYKYLDCALLALKPTGGWIHYYDSGHAKTGENPIEKIELKASKKLQMLGVDFLVAFGKVVRTTGPNWYQVVLDIRVKEPS